MGYQAALEILADPTRRRLVERMRSGPKAVVELAEGLPISRPAVSKHLRVMLDARMVTVRQEGTRRVYALDLDRLNEVRAWLDSFWETSLQRFKKEAEKGAKKDGR